MGGYQGSLRDQRGRGLLDLLLALCRSVHHAPTPPLRGHPSTQAPLAGSHGS